MNAQHTQGPWHVTRETTSGEFVTDTKIRDSAYSVIAVLHVNAAANARLIASAPELLEALEKLCSFDRTITQDDWDDARVAIAKARGQA